MGSDDRGVDHGVFVVGIVRQRFEKTLPNPFDRPAREARVNVLPGSESRRQVAPRNTGPEFPDYCLDEQTIAKVGAEATLQEAFAFLEHDQAERAARRDLRRAAPSRISGSEMLECTTEEEIPVMVSRGEYTDDFLRI